MLPYLCALYAPLVYTQRKKQTTEMMTNYGAGYGQHVRVNLLGALLGRSDHLKAFRVHLTRGSECLLLLVTYGS